RVSKDPVTCWFARTDLETEVDTRLWCGPVQVHGGRLTRVAEVVHRAVGDPDVRRHAGVTRLGPAR
ncbi:hypothetical protein, partial [Actinosynnema sp. NPDC020468]|uniref:hypothetical protein n=1 Tax=Actinosynnema sp. NPDC020468 TaxID=3154488 RepID=UPI0033F1BA2C